MAGRKDLSGERFGKLTAVCPTEERSQKSVVWKCRCDCGNDVFVPAIKLCGGQKKSCGCLRKEQGRSKAEVLTGFRFGRLTAIRATDERSSGSVVWECKCDCGNTVYYPAIFLRSKALSCGCLRKENYIKQARDVTGMRFGRLVAIKPMEERDSSRSVIWQWQCVCGNVIEKSINQVSRGLVQSCGCLNRDTTRDLYVEKIKTNYVLGTNLNILRQSEDKVKSNNTSGVKGVFFLSKENVYVATITFRGVRVYKRYKTLEAATDARRRMRSIHDEFIEWWDSLSEEEKNTACAEFESEKATQIALLKNRIKQFL